VSGCSGSDVGGGERRGWRGWRAWHGSWQHGRWRLCCEWVSAVHHCHGRSKSLEGGGATYLLHITSLTPHTHTHTSTRTRPPAHTHHHQHYHQHNSPVCSSPRRHVPVPGLLLRRRLDAAAGRPRGRACRNELLAHVQACPHRHAALPNIAITPPHASAVHNGRSRSDPHTALPHHRHVATGLCLPPRPAHAAKRLRRSGPTPNLLPYLIFGLAYAAPGQLAPAVQLLASLEDIQPRPHAGAAGPVHSLLAFLVGPDIHIGINMWRRRGHSSSSSPCGAQLTAATTACASQRRCACAGGPKTGTAPRRECGRALTASCRCIVTAFRFIFYTIFTSPVR
jgi:hypothetical protein